MLERLFAIIEKLLTGECIERTEAEQRVVDKETRHLSLYHFPTCPYCLRVRRVIRKLKLEIELRDINRVRGYRTELMTGGGYSMVPCLRIEDSEGNVRWLYESSDINRFLIDRFGRKGEGA